MNKRLKKIASFIAQATGYNFLYKILAVFLAVFFWYLIQGNEIIETNNKINVAIVVPNGYGVKGGDTLVKDATLRGPRAHLAKFANAPLEAEIEIKKERAASFRVRLDREHIEGWDSRVQLTVHEPYIKIETDKLMTKELPIEIFLQGVPADNYIIEKTTVEPETVIITGLQEKVSSLQKISTLPVDINGLQKNKGFVVGLAESNPDISYDVQEVQVNLQVGEKKLNQEFSGIPIEVVDAFYESEIKPQTVAITVQGGTAVLSFIDTKSFKAFVDVGGLNPGRYERKIQAKIPEGTVLIETKPENAFVEIKSRVLEK